MHFVDNVRTGRSFLDDIVREGLFEFGVELNFGTVTELLVRLFLEFARRVF